MYHSHTTIWYSLLAPYMEYLACLEARAPSSKWGKWGSSKWSIMLRSGSKCQHWHLNPVVWTPKSEYPLLSLFSKLPSHFYINRLHIICPLGETIDLHFFPAETLSSKRHFSEVSIVEHQNRLLWQVIKFPLPSFSKITKMRSFEIYTSSRWLSWGLPTLWLCRSMKIKTV